MRVVRSLQESQWLCFREFSVLADGVDQTGESNLAIHSAALRHAIRLYPFEYVRHPKSEIVIAKISDDVILSVMALFFDIWGDAPKSMGRTAIMFSSLLARARGVSHAEI